MATLLSDDFNRANSTTVLGSPATGPAPTIRLGVGGISTNRAYGPTSPFIATYALGTVNVKMEATVAFSSGAGRAFGFVFGWASATDFTLVHFGTGDQESGIYRQNPGGFLEYIYLPTIPANAIIPVSAEYNNGVMAVTVNGVLVTKYNLADVRPITATEHGFRMTNNTVFVDSILGTDSSAIGITDTGTVLLKSFGVDGIPPSSSSDPNGFLYRGRDTKAQDIAGVA